MSSAGSGDHHDPDPFVLSLVPTVRGAGLTKRREHSVATGRIAG
jgi:hypothetical protein